ncbi:MAG: hypothetical protein ACXADB_00030 [Candidatus Hermodarchaeia archaeon]|jgi:hypothetical protein
MKVYVKGKGSVNLGKGDFIAQGGEGAIYAKGTTAYKVYLDPNQMIPEGKIQELSIIQDPNVSKPQHVITSSKGKPIGYTTKFIKKAMPLCVMFPKAFRDRNGITPEMTITLVKRLREMIESIHRANVLVVDLNEMNFLLSTKCDAIYGIDVDSYQTPHFKATALMETVRDRHSGMNVFNEGTDWFSFAITSFQMFRGIHPYKGKHKTLKGLDARMVANVSVLHPDVKVPKAVLPVTVIPQAYLDWYMAVLHDGKRVPPPTDMQPVIVIAPKLQTIRGDGNITITEIPHKIADIIQGVYYSHGFTAVITEKALYNNGRPACMLSSHSHIVGFTNKTNEPVLAHREAMKLKLHNGLRRQEIAIDLDAETIAEYNGRILVKHSSHIYEINLMKAGNDVIATANVIGNVMPKATRLWGGVATQNMLGSMFVSLFPEKGMCYQVKVPELDGYKIIDAKFDGGVMMVVGVKKNRYDRLVFRFDKSYAKYDVRYVKDIIHTGLNFVTLDTGICVCLNEDENIEAFSAKMNSSSLKVVEDSALDGDMRLFKMGGKVGFYRGNRVYSMSMSP